MDIYNYVDIDGETQSIKQAETADGNIIYFDFEVDYQKNKWFVVADLFGKYDQTFYYTEEPEPNTFYIVPDDPETIEKVFINAALFFNSLVSEKDMIIID